MRVAERVLDTGRTISEFFGDVDQVRVEAKAEAEETKKRIGGKLEQLARERARAHDLEKLGAEAEDAAERSTTRLDPIDVDSE